MDLSPASPTVPVMRRAGLTVVAAIEAIGRLYYVGPDALPEQFIVSVRDQGQGFDPDSLKNPLTPENMLSASGRGVFLIRQFMDEVAMRRAPEGGMEVRMTKRIRPTE